MKIVFKDQCVIVTKVKGDPHFSGVKNGAGESRLLYHIKKQLNAQGYDLIKKRMHKDGHLVDDLQQYLRTRKPSGNPDKDIYIYNGMWNIKGAEEYLNEQGFVQLTLVKYIYS